MRRLISAHGRCSLLQGRTQPFKALARSIISQQLSSKAAATIAQRVRSAIGGDLTAARFINTPIEILREAGLSQAKAHYLVGISTRVLEGSLNFSLLKSRSDEEVIILLTAIPGIGRWTAEMFLIFALKRANVLAVGDAGLQKAARLLYGESVGFCRGLWEPYCSVASWYLWRHTDNA